MRLFGPAFPVATAVGDNLWLHRAIEAAGRGSVLVAGAGPSGVSQDDRGGEDPARAFGYWGELMTVAAMRRGIQGLLIDGHVRDRDAIVGLGFPVFCRGLSVRGTGKDPASPGGLLGPIAIGGVPVAEGDLVVGDSDGAAVVARQDAPGVLERARERAAREREILAKLRDGESIVRLLALEAG